MEDDGFFQVIERKKEMIVAGRYNIYPRDIEEVLYEHPKVLDAAVAGVPRSGGGTDLRAFVVLRRGESATAEEIIQFLRERLSAYKLPGAVEFRGAAALVYRHVLRRALTEGLREREVSGQRLGFPSRCLGVPAPKALPAPRGDAHRCRASGAA